MAQTPEGAKRASATRKALYGDDYYHRIGSKGGRQSSRFAKLPKEEVKRISQLGVTAKKKLKEQP